MGRHFRMGNLLSRSSVQSRLQSENGMCFTEFSYQIFQAYDWLQLFREHDCRFQLGGSDQMGNLMSGYELIGRVEDAQVYGKKKNFYVYLNSKGLQCHSVSTSIRTHDNGSLSSFTHACRCSSSSHKKYLGTEMSFAHSRSRTHGSSRAETPGNLKFYNNWII